MTFLRISSALGMPLALLAIAASLSSFTQAGETWDGGGTDNEWSTGANWNTVLGREIPPPNDGAADIIMADTTKLSSHVDVDWDVNSLTFDGTAGAFSIVGFPGVTLGIGAGGMTNNDGQVQTLLLPIGLNTSQTWSAAAGRIELGTGGISSHPILPRTLTLTGGFNTTAAGPITDKITLNKTGEGTLFLIGADANTYSGSTNVTGGTLSLARTGGPARAIPGNLVIGDGAGSDVVRLDLANQISQAVGNTVTVNSAGLLNLNGFNETLNNLAINGGTVSGGTLTLNGTITTGASTTSVISSNIVGNLTVNGAGTLMLFGATSTTTGVIGESGAGGGNVIVTGAGSNWSNSGSVYVGGSASSDGGDGTLTIGAQGRVDIGGALKLWPGGNVALIGGTLKMPMMELAGGSFHWTSGMLRFSSDLSIVPSGPLGGSVGVNAGKNLVAEDDLYVGNAGNGTLTIVNAGSVSARRSFIGNGVGSVGAVVVDGDQAHFSKWATSLALYVGKDGVGSLNIVEGGVVESGLEGSPANASTYIGYGPGSQGAVVVDGALFGMFGEPVYRSTLQTGSLYMGYEGTGSLDVTGGAEARLIGTVYINHNSSNTSTARVIGNGSSWFSGSLQIGGGHGGLGVFEIREGGEAFSGQALVGLNGGYSGQPTSTFNGLVIVQGSGSTWRIDGGAIVPGSLVLGYSGASVGELRVSEGGHVTTEIGRIGSEAGAVGIATLTGSGSNWTNSIEFYVGDMGDGSLSIADGARVETTVAHIGFGLGSTGQVSIDGADSGWINSGNLHVGAAGSGTLALSNGGFVGATDLIIGALGEIRGEGVIAGNIENHGLVSPGTSPGELSIDGDYVQTASGELLIELSSPSVYDRLLIADSHPLRTGVATMGGALTVNLFEGFVPLPGDSFTFLTADDVVGTFATETLPSLPGLIFDVIYNPQSVVLTVSPAFTADFDEDGDVDGDDLTLWEGDFGVNDLSDADNDGDSDGADFLAWQRQLGGGVPAVPAAAVPEPASVLHTCPPLAGLWVIARWHWRRRSDPAIPSRPSFLCQERAWHEGI